MISRKAAECTMRTAAYESLTECGRIAENAHD